MSASYLMGIDIGSTSIKAVIYDLGGNLVASGGSPTVLSHLDREHPQWASWEPEKIWGGVSSAIKEALGKAGDPKAVKAVAVTGFGCDGLPIDKNGEWLYPFISWYCPRTQPQRDAWVEKLGAGKIFSITGRLLWPFDSIYRIMWMKENQPGILEKTYKWVLIEDFVNFMLCGAVATDYSMASCTSVLDLKARNWSDELIGHAGVRKDLFPEIKQSGTYLGQVSKKASELTGLSTDTAVVLGGHDYHCAAIPAGLFDEEVLLDVGGTWEMVLAASGKPKLDKSVFEAGIAVEAHVARDCYTIMGAEVSGSMLEWLKDTYAYEEAETAKKTGGSVWGYMMDKAAQSPCGSKGVFFLPHFAGRSCIAPDPKSLGAFVGLNNTVGKGDMYRAVVEGLNYQFREMLTSIEGIMNKKYGRILAVGGVTRNSFLTQNKSDITGRTIEAVDLDEATSLGAALMAGIGVGLYADEQEAFKRTFKPGRLFEPDLELTARYDKYFEIYKELHPSLKKANSRIFDMFKA